MVNDLEQIHYKIGTRRYLENADWKTRYEEKRYVDIENLVGNLFIAEYQLYERRARLSDIISGYGKS
jgi:hypothetical protein